ncbi:hypothetical protein [Streptomyces flaveolus]
MCIYPEINYGGQPWVRRATGGSVKDLPSAIRGPRQLDPQQLRPHRLCL